MEGIELLESLREKESFLLGEFKKQRELLTKRLLNRLNDIKDYDLDFVDGLEATIDTEWCKWDKPEVTLDIRFKEYNPERIAKGYKYNFGSEIHLYIYTDKIKVNTGTVGLFDKTDKGQVARIYLLKKLFENENELIEIVKDTVDLSVYQSLLETRSKISDINSAIVRAKNEEERLSILKQLKPNRYLAKGHSDLLNPRWDENDNYIYDKKIIRYYNYERIYKVTDKSVLTVDESFKDNHRYPIHDIIEHIKDNSLYILDNSDIKYTELKETKNEN